MNDDIVRGLKYRTSRDYRALWDLAQTQSVACAVDYSFRDDPPGEEACRDICQTIWDGRNLHVSARGIEYVGTLDGEFEEFERQAEKHNLEWIVP